MGEMKISKASLLTMWWIFTLASLWLMFFSVSAVDGGLDTQNRVQLYFDPNNAIQHFQGVKIIATEDGDESYAVVKKNWWLVWIETDYNFLMSGWDTDSNSIDASVRRSTILWWKDNKINGWTNEAILWWKDNKIERGDSSSILWWSGNLLSWNNSSILWWEGNTLEWSSSSIIGWEWNEVKKSYAIAAWNNNTADWYNSVAMWSGAEVSGKNSFLWTDGHSSKTLSKSNVFVVDWQSGMVVNFNKAHSFAQLTIWGSLIIYSGDTAPNCGAGTKWVVKVVNNGDKKCLCSCDGSWITWRNALHDGVMCPFLCSNTSPEDAVCGTANRDCDNDSYTYTWTCKTWTVVQWTGAFFVSTKKDWTTFVNYINWSCQSDTWVVVRCQTGLVWTGCPNKHPQTNGECVWGMDENAELVRGAGDRGWTNYIYENKEEAEKYSCSYVCKKGYFPMSKTECVKCPNWWDAEKQICYGAMVCKKDNTFLEWDEGLGEFNCPDYYWTCVYKDNNGNTKPYDYSDGGYLGNSNIHALKTAGKWKLIPNKWTMTLKCIDADQYKGQYVDNTCSYECNMGNYCKNQGFGNDLLNCTKPSCDWDYAYVGSEKNYMYTWWHAWHYTFKGMMTPEKIATYFEQWRISNNGYYGGKYNTSLTEADVKYIKEKIGKTDTWDIVEYLRGLTEGQFRNLFGETGENGFAKCVYWCPEKNRSYTGTNSEMRSGTDYYCLSTGTKANLNPQRSCPPARFFGYSNEIKFNANATKYGETWEYVSWDNTSTTWCKWSCPAWYTAIRQGAPYYNNLAPNNDSLFVYSSSFLTCYKPCGSNKWLSNVKVNNMSVGTSDSGGLLSCEVCPSWSVPSLFRSYSTSSSTYTWYRGCTCLWDKTWNGTWCACPSDKVLNSAWTECVCTGDMYLSGSSCVCPLGSSKGKNYKCTCAGLNEVFSGWVGLHGWCVCKPWYHKDSLWRCVTSAECDTGWIRKDCLKTCRTPMTGYMFDDNICDQVKKEAKLQLSISNEDVQWSTKTYQILSGITYNVTVTNTWNLEIKNIKVYSLTGTQQNRVIIWTHAGLWVWLTHMFTWKYVFSTGDFNGLSNGQTWKFTIQLTATWKVEDDYVKDLTTNSPTLTVTIKKTRN